MNSKIEDALRVVLDYVDASRPLIGSNYRHEIDKATETLETYLNTFSN